VPSSVFLMFPSEISDNITILRFCDIVEGQASFIKAHKSNSNDILGIVSHPNMYRIKICGEN